VFLAEPQPTPYDLRFHWLGIPIRVAPWFWLVAALLGWNLTPTGEPDGMYLLLWMSAAFVSILVHELGHALAMRFYGISSYIVLYQFGGLTVPERHAYYGGSSRGADDPLRELAITAAGPAAQLALALAIALAVYASPYRLPAVPYLEYVLPLGQGQPFASDAVTLGLFYLLLASVFWALLNLLPVYPLDGGQIVRNLLVLVQGSRGIRNSLIVSMVAGGLVAWYAFTRQQVFLGLMMALLAISSFRTLQAYTGRSGW